MSELEEIQEEETKLEDLTKQTHTKMEIIAEAQKLCAFILGMGKLKAEEVIEKQKLNHNNPVHLLGLAGTFMSDIIIKEIQRMSGDIEKLNKQATELGEENDSLRRGLEKKLNSHLESA
tara:strand:- start:128 stop:484 length:357 start_codon:yes stop_codon:yes gene_type:complete